MGAATFIVELKSGANTDGTRSLRLRITRNSKKAYYNLGIRLKKESYFNPGGSTMKANWIKSHPDAKRHNADIKHHIARLDAIAEANPSYTSAQIKHAYVSPLASAAATSKNIYVSFVEEMIKRFASSDRHCASQLLSYALKVLKLYAAGNLSDDTVLTRRFMSGLHSFMLSLRKKTIDEPKYKPKTIKNYFGALSSAYTKAVEEELIKSDTDPFAALDLFVPPTKGKRPSVDMFAFLMSLDLKENPSRFHARNAFLLQFLLHGGRVSEIVQLQWEHVSESHASYLPSKKGAKWKSIPLTPDIRRLLEFYPKEGKYVLPYLPDNTPQMSGEEVYLLKKRVTKSINASLQSLSKSLGIPKLTTHMARRSFADAALRVLSLREVQYMGGWSSVSMVEKYADEIEQREMDEASALVFGPLSLSGEQ